MILTPSLQEKIVDAITAAPDEPLELPDHAYDRKGRVVVQIQGLPIDLHRHLHNVLIRPLQFHERMLQRGGDRNVNPHLFEVVDDGRSARTSCPKGHEYADNEAPPNPWNIRCLTCLVDLRARRSSTGQIGNANARKTHCPKGHEYTPKNTIVWADGRRRCRTCITSRKETTA